MSKYDLLFGLYLYEKILKITDNLSKIIQNESMSASVAQSIAQQTVLTLRCMRDDLFYQHVDCLRQRTDIEEPSLPRRRKVPRQFKVGDGENYHSSTVEEYYRKLYYEALDSAVSCLLERFDQPGYAMYQNLEELLLKAESGRTIHRICKLSLSFTERTLVKVSFQQLQIFSSSFPKGKQKLLR